MRNEMKSEHDPAPAKEKLATIILAAGKGTRMQSDRAKVLHEVCGNPMLSYSIELAHEMGSRKIVVVVGHQAEEVRRQYADRNIEFAYQGEQLGTGHAVMQTKDKLEDFEGDVLILCGDVPLLTETTIHGMLQDHFSQGSCITVLTTIPDDPSGYGRVVKGDDNRVLKIVEDRDAGDAEKKIGEINTGIYCVKKAFLFDAVAAIGNDNVQKEYYLTDIVEIAGRRQQAVNAFLAEDPLEVMGINTLDELKKASSIMARRRSDTP